MGKLSWIMLMVLIMISFLYFIAFSIYLYNQYKKATIRFYKKKINFEIYCITEREKNRKNQIKNNTTERMDSDLLNSLVGYAMIEFKDENKKVAKTQTMYSTKLSIGRNELNDITLPGKKVSRKQCLIIYRNDRFVIRNLSRTNPTLLNGTPFEGTRELRFNDVIKIANYSLCFQEIINEPCVG